MSLPEQIGGLQHHAGSVGIIMSGWLGTMNYGVIVANKLKDVLRAKSPSRSGYELGSFCTCDMCPSEYSFSFIRVEWTLNPSYANALLKQNILRHKLLFSVRFLMHCIKNRSTNGCLKIASATSAHRSVSERRSPRQSRGSLALYLPSTMSSNTEWRSTLVIRLHRLG